MIGFICMPHRYLYKGVTIEVSGIGGPCVIKINGDPYRRLTKIQSEVLMEFCSLDDSEAEKFHIGGGCVPL